MALKFSDGAFRVSCCAHGHVTLEVLDGEAVRFVSVMSRTEARQLAARLSLMADLRPAVGRRARSLPEVH